MSHGLAAVIAVALASAAGCGAPTYVGGARPIDPARLTAEPGWIMSGATPALRQKRVDDCGPAVLAMVAGHWQVKVSIAELVALLPPPGPLGARLGDLRDVARARGLVAFAIAGDQATLVHELRAGRPVIVGLKLPYSGRRTLPHYEVVVAAHPEAGRVVTIDPARASWRTRTWAELDAEWAPAGRPTLVVVGRAPEPAVARAAAAVNVSSSPS